MESFSSRQSSAQSIADEPVRELQQTVQLVRADQIGLLDAGQMLAPDRGPGHDAHRALTALDEPQETGLHRTGGLILSSPGRPLLLQSAGAGGRPSPEDIPRAIDHFRAGHRVGDVPVVFGHDHRLPLQEASDHRFGGARKKRQVQAKSGFTRGRDQVAEGDSRLDHSDAVLEVEPHDPIHPAQVDDDRSPDTGDGVAPEVGPPRADGDQRSSRRIGPLDYLLYLVRIFGSHHTARRDGMDETLVRRVFTEGCRCVGHIVGTDYVGQFCLL